MKFSPLQWILLGGILLLSSLALAQNQKMKIDDIISLKAMGYSDGEILKDLKKSKASFDSLTSKDIQKLKKNGVGPQLLKYLLSFRKKLTVKDILALAKEGKKDVEIIGHLRSSEAKFKLSPREILKLHRQGLSMAVLLAMRGHPLKEKELFLLARKKTPPPSFLALARYLGIEKKLSPQKALKLHKAGVDTKVLKFLRQLSPSQKTTSKKEGPPVEGDWKKYSHPTGQFRLHLPSQWKLLDLLDGEVPLYVFSPEKKNRYTLPALHVEYFPLTATNALRQRSLKECFSWYRGRLLPHTTHLGEGEESEVKTGGERGQYKLRVWTLQGKWKKQSQSSVFHIALARSDKKIFAFNLVTREKRKKLFSQILAKVELGRPFNERRKKNLTPQELIENYKEAVISVRATTEGRGGTGTGFIIRSDGYLITNHHVVYDEKKKKFHKKFEISWDASLGRETVPARLIDAKREKGSAYMFSGKGRILDLSLTTRKDIALLKIQTPGRYKAIPISPIENVKLGDPCVAMGFPKRTLFQNLSLFVTQGVVVRFNRDVQGTVHSVYTDAKITHGNSGGPCVNLATGGVFGINTFGYDIRSGRDPLKINDLVGYYGVTSINSAIEEFPLYFYLQPGYQSRFSLLDYYRVAYDLALYKRWEGALEMTKKMLEIQPSHPDGLRLKGYCMVMTGEAKKGVKVLEESFKQNPNHYPTLMTLALVRRITRSYAQASDYVDRAIKLEADNPEGYIFRARLYFRTKRPADALKDVDKALQLSRGFSLKALILAGEIKYALEDFKGGREYFQKALKVDPWNLRAAMGLGKYYGNQKKWEAAVLEYGKVRRKFPRHPVPIKAIGDCYIQLKQYSQAQDAYQKALQFSKKLGMTPSGSMLLNLGWIEQYQKRDHKAAIRAYREYLNYHYREDEAQKVHINLARLFLQSKLSNALAYAHSLVAKKQFKSKKLLKLLPKVPASSLAYRDIRLMVKLGYQAPVMIQLIRQAPLAIRVSTQQGMRNLVKKGIPASVALIIYLKTRRDSQPGRLSSPKTLVQNLKVKIDKFYYSKKSRSWHVRYYLSNYNSVSIENPRLRFTFKDSNRKVLKTWEKTLPITIGAKKKISQTESWPNRGYPPSRNYISIAPLSVKSARQPKKGPETTNKSHFRISTGPLGGTYHKMGLALAKIGPQAGFNMSVVTTQGSVDNLLNVARGKTNFAFVQYDAIQAFFSSEKLKSLSQNITRIIPVFDEEIHILVRKNSGISRLSQLKGKKVHLGYVGSGTFISGIQLLKAAGLTKKDVSLIKGATKNGLDQLVSGQVDCLFYTVGAPAQLLKNLSTGQASRLKLLSLPPLEWNKLKLSLRLKSGYRLSYLSQTTYPWMTSNARVPVVSCYLVTNAKEPSSSVVKVLTEIRKNQSTLAKTHSKWKEIRWYTLKMFKNSSSFHPGVKEFLRTWKNSSPNRKNRKQPKQPKISSQKRKQIEKNIKVKILKYKRSKSGSYWILRYKIVNNNSKTLRNLKVRFTLKSKSKKVLRIWTKKLPYTLRGRRKITMVETWKNSEYPNSYYIQVEVVDFEVR